MLFLLGWAERRWYQSNKVMVWHFPSSFHVWLRDVSPWMPVGTADSCWLWCLHLILLLVWRVPFLSVNGWWRAAVVSLTHFAPVQGWVLPSRVCTPLGSQCPWVESMLPPTTGSSHALKTWRTFGGSFSTRLCPPNLCWCRVLTGDSLIDVP